ncbi:MAG TPA: 2,3-bisphosphoglycerate-independent phosphoglycerate mutase [Candidatus Bathyarchaeia archaeon]|nr:2,3-bisphosphoglycerate-independent phosphoglycerate mutase [Candidatus Bathyarchaeia archaeon]
MTHPPLALIILDGFGYSAEKEYNAIAHARTPHITAWFSRYPHTLLCASGPCVGLPHGYIGNSEVGHITIGAGQRIEQPVTIINRALENGSFYTHHTLTTSLHNLAGTKKRVHILGLLSDAGIHGLDSHIYAYMRAAYDAGVSEIIIHPFLDGRDTAPRSATIFLTRLDEEMHKYPHAYIGTIHGRFYAMDRDQNWKRTRQSYYTLTNHQTSPFDSWQQMLDHYYAQNITDEFIPPTPFDTAGILEEGDGILFSNVRPDRARQLAAAICNDNFNQFPTKKYHFCFCLTPVSYGDMITATPLFERPPVHHTLKEILSVHQKTIFSIAETEKYAHVTYFFDGERDIHYPGETRALIPSIKTKTYEHFPAMSAEHITQTVITSLSTNPCNFYLINYANADMVAHSGNFDATVQAIESLDTYLARIYTQLVIHMHGTLIITADHGKAESMYDPATHQPKTAHTANPVPFIVISNHAQQYMQQVKKMRQLCEITPFILHLFSIPKPINMCSLSFLQNLP